MKTHVIDIVDRLSVALAGRYSIERELGRGGMATVYLAQDPLCIAGPPDRSSHEQGSFRRLLEMS